MAKVAFKQADVARLVRGAVDGGMPIGSFAIQLVNGAPTLVPIDGPVHVTKAVPDLDEAALADIERLIANHG